MTFEQVTFWRCTECKMLFNCSCAPEQHKCRDDSAGGMTKEEAIDFAKYVVNQSDSEVIRLRDNWEEFMSVYQDRVFWINQAQGVTGEDVLRAAKHDYEECKLKHEICVEILRRRKN